MSDSIATLKKKLTKTIPIFFFAAADPNFNKQKKWYITKSSTLLQNLLTKSFVNT